MATVKIMYWQDIPYAVRAFDENGRSSKQLPRVFEAAVDEAAMVAGMTEQSDTGGVVTLAWTADNDALTEATSDSDNTYGMTCTVSDGAGGTDTDTFVITVTAVNDVPVQSGNTATSVNEGAEGPPVYNLVSKYIEQAGTVSVPENKNIRVTGL